MCLLQAWSEIQSTCRAVAEQIAGTLEISSGKAVPGPSACAAATIVLSNTFWSTGALVPEKTHFVELLEITHPVMHAAHLTLALVFFGAANHCLHIT